MPSFYDQPRAFANAAVEDVEKFNKLPYYLVHNEVGYWPQWRGFSEVLGSIAWQPNMADTMKGVRAEPTPMGRTTFYPNRINTDPAKDVFETYEVTEEAQLYWHEYESFIFNFLPSFQDFRKNQLDFNHKDIVRQASYGDDAFHRTRIWDFSPYVFFPNGKNNDTIDSFVQYGLCAAPTALGNADQDAANSKTAAWLQAITGSLNIHPLTYRQLKLAISAMMEDIQAPFLEGGKSGSKDEYVKGRYCFYGSGEAYMQFVDDPDVRDLRPDNMSLLGGFSVPLANGTVSWKIQRFPLRFGDDGTFIVPQVIDEDNKTVPNPNYVRTDVAKYEIGFMIGSGAYRIVEVGAPPIDFTKVDRDKFWKMRWNGEIYLTDQFLLRRGTIDGGDLDFETNQRGRYLKFAGTVTHGILPGERRYIMPVVYKRQRRTQLG